MNNRTNASELKKLFDTFQKSTPKGRKTMLPNIEAACAQFQSFGISPYASQCISRLLESCRKMARLRQPKDYDEFKQISHALGDLDNLFGELDES